MTLDMIEAIVQGIGDHLEQRGFHVVRHNHHRAVTVRRNNLSVPFFDVGIFNGAEVLVKTFDSSYRGTGPPQTTLIDQTRVDLANPEMLEMIERTLIRGTSNGN